MHAQLLGGGGAIALAGVERGAEQGGSTSAR